MSTIIFANNAQSTLAGPITLTATSVQLAAGTGALFPNPSAGQYFKITFISANPASTANEICNVTAVSGDILTIVRGQEGTAAQAWNAGDICANQLTAGSLGAFLQSVGVSSQFYQGTDTGASPNVAVVTSFTPSLVALASGQIFLITKNNLSNTSAVTIQYGVSGTPYAAVYSDGTQFVQNDWPGGVTGWFFFTGAVFQLISFGLHTLPIDGGAMTGLLQAPQGFVTDVDVMSTSTTLTEANAGHVVELTAGSASTFTLFAPSLIKACLRFYNNSSATHTISTPSSNFFGPTLVGSPTTHTIAPGDIIDLTADGSKWLCLDWDAIIQSLNSSGGITNIQMITASGSYTPTAGAKKALAFATGAGGSGASVLSCGGGGGAGATAIALVDLTSIVTIACTIGAGGAAVTASSGGRTAGAAGGATSFGTYAVAGGGAGADNAANGGAGGTVTTGLSIPGAYGNTANNDNLYGNGQGGGSFWGGGGYAGNPNGSGTNGGAGLAYGSGGGGVDSSFSNRTSGAGANGVILILEF